MPLGDSMAAMLAVPKGQGVSHASRTMSRNAAGGRRVAGVKLRYNIP